MIFKMTWLGFQVVQFFPMVHGLPGHGYCCQKLFHIQLVSLWSSSQCSLNRNRPDEEVPDVTDQYGTVLGYNEPNQVELLFTNNKPKHIVSTTK